MDVAGRGPLRAEVLGPVRAWAGTRRLDLGAPLQQAAFVVLAFRAGRAVSRDEFIDALWGTDPPPSAENGVHTYVKGLRRVLEPARAAWAPGQMLISTSAGYELVLPPDRLDATVFGQQLDQGRHLRAAGDLAGMVRSADAALALWHGAPLPGIPGPFAEIERTRLGELRLGAIEERAEVMLDLGRHAEVGAELPAVVSEYPFRERLRGLLMLALYRGGRQADALAVFHDTRRILAAELGIEPSRDLNRLHQQILSSDTALDLPSAAIIDPRRPGREWRPAELPHDVAGFTNREEELAELRAMLAVGDEHQGPGLVISAIDGPAGVGKTAVAVHAAHQVASRFPDGQLYLDLRGFHPREPALPPDEALGHLLRACQVDPHQIPHDLNGRAAMYRSVLSGKRTLIILDNAATAEQVRPLLPGSASCAVIVTSRNRLGSLVVRDGARRVTLDTLAPHHALDVVARIAGPRRLAAEPAAAADLARLCGYLPLALRVAAERVAARPHLSLSELAGRLAVEHDRLDMLAADEETAAVRAVLSWSYRALPPLAARLFRLLALHPGTGISGPAASALAMTSTAEAQRLLDDLTNAHLLEETGPGRYQFHDLVRLYAREVVAEQETAADRADAVRRLLHWYLHTADSACTVLNPRRPRVPLSPPETTISPLAFPDHDKALRWCEEERANTVAAVHLAAANGDHTTAWQLPMAMFDFFSLRTLWTDWVATNLLGLDSARHLGDEFGEAAILTSLGIAYFDQRRFGDAIDCLRRALPIWRAIGFPQAEAVTLDPLGAAYRDTGQLSEALDCLHQALRIWRDVGDRWGEGITLHNLGDTYRDLGRLGEAITHLQQSHSVRDQIGDQWGLAWTLHDLGSAYADLRRYDDAIDCYQQALTIRGQIGDRHGEARTLRRLGHIYRIVGRPEMASDLWKQAQAIFEDLGDHPRTAQVRASIDDL
ncbi:MAG TPA: tetratricopeptide repeat protein [Streptosporangiaceae bacterium]|nr:tetratricopeptide repeat protein [Streptosporangiaceae bacterium]